MISIQTPHQNNCYFRTASIDTVTYPTSVYAFLDTTPVLQYENGSMDEWYSFFERGDSFFQNCSPTFESPSVSDTDLSRFNPVFVNLVRNWIDFCSNNQLTISVSAMDAIETCLEVFLSSALNACNEESLNRTRQENQRVLVPALFGGAISKCPYLQLISNSGLMKPSAV